MDRIEIKDAFVDFLRSNGYHKEDLINNYEGILNDFEQFYQDEFDPEMFEAVLGELRAKIARGVEKQLHRESKEEYEGNDDVELDAAADEEYEGYKIDEKPSKYDRMYGPNGSSDTGRDGRDEDR